MTRNNVSNIIIVFSFILSLVGKALEKGVGLVLVRLHSFTSFPNCTGGHRGCGMIQKYNFFAASPHLSRCVQRLQMVKARSSVSSRKVLNEISRWGAVGGDYSHLSGGLRSTSSQQGQQSTLCRLYFDPQPFAKLRRTACGSKGPSCSWGSRILA